MIIKRVTPCFDPAYEDCQGAGLLYSVVVSPGHLWPFEAEPARSHWKMWKGHLCTVDCEKDEVTLWQKSVYFAKDEAHRASGYAFVEAAREQDREAAQAIDALSEWFFAKDTRLKAIVDVVADSRRVDR